MALELVGGLVAKEFQAAALFGEGHTLVDEAFQFERADIRTVLFILAALLGALVGVTLALNAVNPSRLTRPNFNS